jgi:hypothetical protein
MTSWECYENKWFYMKYIGKSQIYVNSWRHNFIWLYSKIWWKNKKIVFKSILKAKKNNMCASDRPTDPKILPPTLTFFIPKKIIDHIKGENFIKIG